MMNGKRMLWLGGFLLLASCQDDSVNPGPETQPAWVRTRIERYQSEPAAIPPRTITEFDYGVSKAYLVSSTCCDQYDSLFDADQKYLCAPMGGLDAHGDGKCEGFDPNGTGGRVIWRDGRSPPE